MKPFKLDYAILAAGIFILILSALLGTAVLCKFNETCGAYGTGKVSADLQYNMDPKGNSAIILEDIRHLMLFSFKGLDIAYASEGKTTAVFGENQTQTSIYGVSDSYNMFHQLEMKSGSFITPGNRKEMVAVVDEDLAVALFNHTNIVGMYLELYGQRFRIIGVISSDWSIAQALTDDGYGIAYIPVEHMLEYDTAARITSLEVKAADMGTTAANMNIMKEALASVGKNPADYRILDYNIEKKLIEEKMQVVIFISGVGIIVMLLHLIKGKAMDIYVIVKAAFRDYYLKDVIRLKCVKPVYILMEISAALALMLVVWDTVRFNLYIPTQYIPDELIDIDFYSDLFESLMQQRVQNAGYIPSIAEMKTNALAALQTLNLIVGVFAGFPAYFLGLRLLEQKQGSPIKCMLLSFVFISISIASSLLLINMLNIPIVVNTKGLLVIAAFILLSSAGLGQSIQENESSLYNNRRSDM